MTISLESDAAGDGGKINVNGVPVVQIGADGISTDSLAQPLTHTSQVVLSGTAVDVTGIPSWVRRITILFDLVSTNGTSEYLVRVGSGVISASGYSAGTGNAAVYRTNSTGFPIEAGSATLSITGHMVLTRLGGTNVWVSSHTVCRVNDGIPAAGGGRITLGSALDRLRITTANGTDVFDSGSMSLLYE